MTAETNAAALAAKLDQLADEAELIHLQSWQYIQTVTRKAAAPSAPVLAEPQQPCQACINGEPTCKACGKGAQQPVQGGGDAVTDEQIDAVTVAQFGPQHGAPLQAQRAYARSILALPPAQPAPQAQEPSRSQNAESDAQAVLTLTGEPVAQQAQGVEKRAMDVLRAVHRRPSDAVLWLDDISALLRAERDTHPSPVAQPEALPVQKKS